MAGSMTADLARSGLTPEDLGAKEAGSPELAAIRVPTSTQGYVIPYYQPNGDRLPFYRVKLFGQELKYKQVHGTSNHIYFPRNFKETLEAHLAACKRAKKKPFIVLTEGEKKAAACCRHGIPCCALGGVDSWRNKTIILPPETKLDNATKESGSIRAKLPPGDITMREDFSLAMGMQSLVDALVSLDLPIIIIYDTDEKGGLKMEVQRAAATLAHQFIHMGIPIKNVRQVILPFEDKKVGLDDYLLTHKAAELESLCYAALAERGAFPRHPNPRALVNNKLQAGNLSRKEVQEVSLTVLAELDARGRRLRAAASALPYYFDERSLKLMPVQLMQKQNEPIHESVFGRFLYQEYGIASADTRVFSWLGAQFTGEDPIEEVSPYKVVTVHPDRPDEIAVQISDSHFIVVSGDAKKPFQVFTNGNYGLLFEQEQVEGIDAKELEVELAKQMKVEIDCWWLHVFKNSVNLVGDDKVATMAALLYYISPWLLRWRGTQLPAELLIGEAGSGKSSLYELRLSILTGAPLLRNIPSDLRDWFASIVNIGGLHVIDNVQFTNKELRQRLSDEMCRIITEPKPHVEMRRLYTTSGQQRLPVNTVFAMTAIQQPFFNADIIQRAAIFELSAVGAGHDGSWVASQLAHFGGRVPWLAHQLVFLHKFLNRVQAGDWKADYKADHRLANYEQCLNIAAKVFGMEHKWIGGSLVERSQEKIIEADWSLRVIKDYAEMIRRANPGKEIDSNVQMLCDWAQMHEQHCNHPMMQQSNQMDGYLKNNTSKLLQICKVEVLMEPGRNTNRRFKVLSIK
jgi:hypothetical protein